MLRHDWPLVEVTIPLVLILSLGALDLIKDTTAILLAVFAALLELGTSGAYAARSSGAGIPMTRPLGGGRGGARRRGRAAEGARPLRDSARAR